MPVFAPGIWQGVNQSMALDQQKAQQARENAWKQQQADMQRTLFEQAQSDRARQRDAQQSIGQSLGAMYPQAPSPVAPPPMPGQPSVPMFSQGQGQQMPPQGIQGVAPGMGMSPPQKQPVPPYRSMAQMTGPGAAQTPQQGMGQPSPMAPPPVQTSQPQGGGDLLGQLVQGFRKDNVPPDQWGDRIEALSPILKLKAQEELDALKAQGMGTNMMVKQLQLALSEAREADRVRHEGVMEKQGQDRINLKGKKGAGDGEGVGGGAGKPLDQKRQDALDDMAWKYIETNNLPYRKGKGGQGDPNTAIITRAGEIARSLKMSPQELAAQPAQFKANAQALNQNTKSIASIEPFNDMVKKNGQILKDLSAAAKGTGSPWANKSLNWLSTHPSSDPAQSKMLGQMLLFQSEVAKVTQNPNLTGQLTDTARAEVQKVINGEMSPETIGQMVDLLSADGDRRVASLYDQQAKLQGKLTGKGAAPAASSQVMSLDDYLKSKGH